MENQLTSGCSQTELEFEAPLCRTRTLPEHHISCCPRRRNSQGLGRGGTMTDSELLCL